MSLVNENSPVITLPELDFFTTVPVQTSIEATRTQEIRPLSLLNTGGHIEFIVPSAPNEYIRPDDTTLYIKARVLLSNSDGTPVAKDDWKKIAPVNNFFNSLWSQVDLAIGDTQTTLSLQTYPYRSYFDLLFRSALVPRETYMKEVLFYRDDLKTETKDTVTIDHNSPNILRNAHITYVRPTDASTDIDLDKGKWFELEGKLHIDMLFQPKAIIGGTTLKFKLVPNRPEFYFMIKDSTDKLRAKIEFGELHLNVVKCKVNNDIVAAHHAALNICPARYPIERHEVRTVIVDKGVTSRSLENVINGQLPKRLYLAFVENQAYSGNYKKNPFYFTNHNIRSLACYVNGEQYPLKAYKPDFTNNLFLREYLALVKTLNQYNNDTTIPVSKITYNTGYTIFAFDISADYSEAYYSTGYVNVPRSGVLRIELEFASATTEILNAIIFTEYDNQISIPEDKNAITDYH